MHDQTDRYQLNDYIIHSESGICIVDQIGIPDESVIKTTKQYYVLHPVSDKNCKLYVPTDNTTCIIRRAMTKEQALDLLSHVSETPVMCFADSKNSKDSYRKALKSCETDLWLSLIKTLFNKNNQSMEQGKRANSTDNKYLKLAANFLFWELSIALDVSKDTAEQSVLDRFVVEPLT